VSISLAQKIAQIEPGLDSRLARLLPGRGDGSPEVSAILPSGGNLERRPDCAFNHALDALFG
jgi:hypothetical protein